MRTLEQILELLPRLDHVVADGLEEQDLDFKEWNARSIDDSVRLVVEMAVCMANGGGGTVVLGVRDQMLGRQSAIVGVPPEVDVNRLKRAVYDRTDPKITPVFEELAVPQGTGRLLVMQIHPGIPPYTDTSGTAKVRIGKDCQPLTGSLRKRLMVETGETDATAPLVPGDWQSHVSPVALEKLRGMAAEEKAPRELLGLSDGELRLVNRSNLGIGRMYEALLIEGKEPPDIQELGETIVVSFRKQDVSAPFRAFVAEEGRQGRVLGVDELLVLQFLLRHTELETTHAATLCQRPEPAMRATLSRMERDHGWIQRGGTGRGTYWTLSLPLARKLRVDLAESVARIDKEAAKTRVLSILKQRAEAGEAGLSNSDLRKITSFDRTQVKGLMRELRAAHPQIQVTGERKAARYVYDPDMESP